MKSSTIALTILILSVTSALSSAAAQELASDTTAALKEIHAVVEAYEATWNDNDITAWGALFTDDVDYVHRGGGRWISNEENVEGHRRIHQRLAAENQPMNLQLSVEDVAFLSPSIALVHVTSRWPGFTPPGAEGENLGAMMTMVMVEKDGTWLIRAFHNTLIANPSP